MSDRENRIQGLLTHYFESVWRKAQMGWDGDNSGEMGELAHLIVWEPPDPNAPQRGSGKCICSFSPEKQEKWAKSQGYQGWVDRATKDAAGVATVDHRCPAHGEKAQPALWGRHKQLTLHVTAVEWDSLGIKYDKVEE